MTTTPSLPLRARPVDRGAAAAPSLSLAPARLDPLTVIAILLITLRPLLDVFRDTAIGPLSVTDVTGIAILALAAVPTLTGSLRLGTSTTSRLLLAFVVIAIPYGFAAVWWSQPHAVVTTSLRLLVILCGYALFRQLGLRDPKVVPRLLASAAVPACLLALVQLATGAGLPASQYVQEAGVVRVFGPFDHPNALAIYAAMIAVVAVSCMLGRRNPLRNGGVWLAVAALCAAAVLPTYARVVWVSLPLALVVLGTATRRPAIPVATVALGVAAAVHFAGAEVATRLSGFSSLRFREELWRGLLSQMRLAEALLGVGLGQINYLVETTTAQIGLSRVIQVHNDYLRVFIETGLVGFALYFGAILAAAWRCYRALHKGGFDVWTRRLVCATLGSSVVVLLVSLTDNIFELPVLQLVFWGLTGSTMGALDRADADAAAARRSQPDLSNA